MTLGGETVQPDMSDLEVSDVIVGLLGLSEIYYRLGNFTESVRLSGLAEKWERKFRSRNFVRNVVN